MCGLTGGWTKERFNKLREALPNMGKVQRHRGPDDMGVWLDAEAGIAMVHNRLAIVDLTSAGHQPMTSHSGRWIIAFNGEIYNHMIIREEMASAGLAPSWRGHSDTETLLAAIEAWGVEAALKRTVGMFAFAAWDRYERNLWLARDRFGEKPLYYGWQGGIFWFGSELKSLRQLGIGSLRLNSAALALYLRYQAVPAPHSIYDGIAKLLPGHWLKLDYRQLEKGEEVLPQPYWRADEAAHAGLASAFSGSETEAVDALEAVLSNAVAGQLMSDVPVGAFLSGGVDSSTVVALMQAQSARPIRTFSIGFHEEGYDEAQHAAEVARHLGTNHTELYLTPKDALDVIPRLPSIYDEPFSDSSQVPTFLVSRMAREHVTVALSGDGGDELFGGYNRYFSAKRIWNKIARVPAPIRRVTGRAITTLSVERWNQLYTMADPLIPTAFKLACPGDKIHKGGVLIGAGSGRELYNEMISCWQPDALLNTEQKVTSFGPPRIQPMGDLMDYMMLEDTCHYMTDDILVKVDRAAMNNSLETRVPLLDHRVFEFAWTLPRVMKVGSGSGKHILRQLLYRHVPRSLIDRPKMGFGVPIDVWLRGPLKDWAANLLDPSSLRHQGYLNPEPITRKWNEHQSGKRNWQYHLWNVLMFQAWLDENKK
jgi:asparagine synthase (glutamine-hydrolysing)